MSRRGSAGVTLLELVVALAVGSLMLLVSTELLVELHRSSAGELGKEPAEIGQVGLALAHFERDAMHASIGGCELPEIPGLAPGDLGMQLVDGRVVGYRAENGRLYRLTAPEAGGEFHAQVLIDGGVGAVMGFDIRKREFQMALDVAGEVPRYRTVRSRNDSGAPSCPPPTACNGG